MFLSEKFGDFVRQKCYESLFSLETIIVINIIVGIFFQVISRYVMRNSKDGKRKINFLIKNIVETDSDIHKAKMLPKPVFN